MAKMNGSHRYMFDAAPSITLMAQGEAAETASFDSDAVAFDQLEGYWTSDELADQTLAVIVNVTDVEASARTATMTFVSVVNTDTFTLDDGVDSKVFTCVTAGANIENGEFNVGASNTLTAAAAVVAINDAYADGDIAISATSELGVITLTNHLGTGGTITEAETTITTTAFAGNNETYVFDVEVGPVGFASSAVVGKLTISETGQYVVPLDMGSVVKTKSDAAAIRIAGTLAGVGPSITAFSWIAAIQR